MRRMRFEAAGFSLVELIAVIILLGILAGFGVQIVRPAVDAYVATVQRSGLAESADLIARRIEREVHDALPNSLRVTAAGTGYALEFVPVVGAGLYRTASVTASHDALRFDVADTGFDVLGFVPVYDDANQVVIANLGAGSGSDVYDATTGNRVALSSTNAAESTSTDAAPHKITFATAQQFPVPSPANRFYLVSKPVAYVCDPGARTLKRVSGIDFAATQVAPPATGVTMSLSSQLTACRISYAPSLSLNSRTGLLSMELTLSSAAGESVQVLVQVNVSNEP